MKSYLFFIIVLIITCPTNILSQEIHGKLEYGYDPWQNYSIVDIKTSVFLPVWKLRPEIYFRIKTAVDNQNIDNIDKNIVYNLYDMGGLIHIEKFYFGYTHDCFHPINTYLDKYSESQIKFGFEW